MADIKKPIADETTATETTATKAAPKAKTTAKPKAVAASATGKTKTEPKPKAEPKAKTAAKAEPKAMAETKAKAAPKPKVEPKTKAAVNTTTAEKTVPKAKAEPKPKAAPKPKAEPKAKTEITAKAEPKDKAATKAKVEPKTELKQEVKAIAKPEEKKALSVPKIEEVKPAPAKTILFATSEAHPFARTGGLGDVSSALPKALTGLNTDTRVIMPLYHDIPSELRSTFRYVGSVYVTLAWRYQYCGLFSCNYEGVTYYFIDNEQYFKRSGLYGHYDDAERFAFFSKAILECLRLIDFYPEVIHCNDWQTALVPVFLDSFYRGYVEYKNIKTVYTIHNIEFQGRYGKQLIKEILGLPVECIPWVEYMSDTNFMKGGIERANAITTVSPSYAREIMDRYYAYGLDVILSERSYKLSGIINGIDVNLFNPATDKSLFVNYDYDKIELKKENKRGLMNMLGMEFSESRPLIGMVTRLTEQKGMDLLINVIKEVCEADCQLVILGTGDWKYESKLQEIAEYYPNKLKVIVTFSTDIANKIYAGSDMFLMPSKFEPCGLSQMIAMRYGTVPIVRETGGLKDTVTPFNPEEMSGKGFTFYSYNPYDMLDAIYRAIGVFYKKREWYAIMAEDMNTDFSWDKSAKQYLELYNKI